MKIQRIIRGSEVEIELTSDELFRAYSEQEHKFDIDDILEELETGGEDTDNYNDIPIAWLKEKFSEIAFLKRRNIDKYGLEWSEAVKQAINDYAGENWNGMG